MNSNLQSESVTEREGKNLLTPQNDNKTALQFHLKIVFGRYQRMVFYYSLLLLFLYIFSLS